VILSRLDQLTEDAKWVLRTASVIGRSFLYRLLAVLVEDDEYLDRQLKALQKSEFIHVKQKLPELEYIFKHALAQETIYESILLEKRRELHSQVGRTIERLFSKRLEEFYGLVAYHFARAELWEKAQDYLLKAGDQAVALAADAEALAYYRLALQTYTKAGGESWSALQRAAFERKVAFALFYRGESEQAEQTLMRALNYLGIKLPASTWGIRLAILKEGLQQIAHRLLPWLFLARSYKEPTPSLSEEIRIYEGFSWMDVISNQERMLLTTLRLLNRCERKGAAWGVAGGSMALAFAMTLVPLKRFPEGYYRRALALAEEENFLDIVGLVNHGRSWYEAFQGNWEEALAFSQRATEITQVTGKPLNWAFPRFQIALILAYQGFYDQALTYCRQLIDFGREGAAAQVLCWGLAALGYVKRHQGLLDEAMAASDEAVKMARSIPDQGFVISASAELGRSCLIKGRLDEALRLLEESLGAYQDFLGPDSYVSLYNGLAEVQLVAAEQNYQNNKSGWLKKAGKACRKARKLGNKFVPATPEAMRLQGTYEWLRGNKANAQSWWQRSLVMAGKLGQPYDLGKTHLEIGRRLSQVEDLHLALATFTEIGAVMDHSLAEEAVANLS
jgi:tetratricopeptide (TPR) repeat protein